MAGLLLDCDEQVAAWAFKTYNRLPMKIDRAFGIIDTKGQLAGAAIFSSYNWVNAELSYFGTNTITRGIVRQLARIALYELRLVRCTVIVPKRPGFLLRKLPKFGFRFEGIQRQYYGPSNSARHTGCRFVLFRPDIEKLASQQLRKAA